MRQKYPRILKNRCSFIASLVAGKSVLDIGCVGHTLENCVQSHWLHEYLKRSAKTILGLDYEKDEIEKMKNAGYNVISADATDFHLNQKFEVIVAGELIEHICNPGLFLQCTKEHLSDGGRLILTTPNANCLVYFLENLFLGKEIENSDHVCIYSPKTLSKLLEKNGFMAQNIIFLAENTSFYHDSPMIKLLVHIKQILQSIFCLFRPCMAHQMIIIATVDQEKSKDT